MNEQASPVPPARVPSEAKARGASATASPSTPTSSSRRTTTPSTSAPVSRTSTPSAASPRSTPTTCAAGCAGGVSTQRAAGFDGGKTATVDPAELDAEFFMLRVRSDGKILGPERAARARRGLHDVRTEHRGHHRPQQHPVPLDPDRGRPRDLGAPRGGRPGQPGGVRRLAAAVPRLPSPASPRTRSSTAPRRWPRSSGASSATRTSPTCRASSRPRSPATPATTSPPRSTTCRSWAPCTPSTAPASTCGSAAGSPRTRCSRRSSASGSRWTRLPTPGRAWPRSSATTATAARGRAPG